jgi:hypothetical protein
MLQVSLFDSGHADGIRHADMAAVARVLNAVIYECHCSLEAIGLAELDMEARERVRGMGLGG